MNVAVLNRPLILLERLLEPLQPLFLLVTRCYVGWQFLKSGWLKITNWDSTVELFTSEYHVPLLPPVAAAASGALGELIFSALIILGVGGRVGPIGLFMVNVMAVVAYQQVLLAEGFEAALAQHVLWGFMLAMLAILGNGSWTLDRLLGIPRR